MQLLVRYVQLMRVCNGMYKLCVCIEYSIYKDSQLGWKGRNNYVVE